MYEVPKSKLKLVFAEETQGNAPAHPLLVGPELSQRSPRNERQGQVPGMKMRQQAVEACGVPELVQSI